MVKTLIQHLVFITLNYNIQAMNIKRSIRFVIRKEKEGRIRIVMRVSFKCMAVDFQTGIVANEGDFDIKLQRITNCNLDSSYVSQCNDKFSLMTANMIKTFQYFESQETIPTAQALREVYNSIANGTALKLENSIKSSGIPIVKVKDNSETNIKKPKAKSFWTCYDEFVRVNSKLNDWTDATRAKFATMRNHLHDFKKDLTFDDLNEDGIANYISFLSKIKMKNSTINKQLGFLRWVLRWCYEKGYHQNKTFEYYKPKLKNAKKRVIFLTKEELEKVENFKIPKEHEALEPIRDVFLFTCYTGLRHSDVFNLTWSDLHDGKIEIVTEKTVDRLVIELNRKAMSIIKKYSDIRFPKHKILPVRSNQIMNKDLHKLFKLIGIDSPIKITHYEGNKRVDEVRPKYELIGTHTGRRTFICTALAKGIPPTVVMKWTGHSDYKAMKPYIDVADEVKESYMKRFDEPNETNEDEQKNETK